MKMMTGFDNDSEKDFANAGSTASEAVDNIDTVSSLGVQDHFIEQYSEALRGPLRVGRRKAVVTGIAFGFSDFCQYIIWAVAL